MVQSVPASTVPGPEGFLGLQNIRDLRQIGMLNFFLRAWREYGDFLRLSIGPGEFFIAVHPDMVRQITVTHSDHYSKVKSYEVVRRLLLGNGLVTSTGDDWLWQRRMMSEFFTPRAVTAFLDPMAAEVEDMLGQWRRTASAQPIDVSEAMVGVTANIILKAVFTTQDQRGLASVKGDVEHMLNFAGSRERTLVKFPMWWPASAYRNFHAARSRVYGFVRGLVEQRNALPESAWPEDLLSKMMRVRDEDTGRQLSEQEVVDNSVTFFVAGHETTARTMTFALYALSQNPGVEAALIEEVDRAMHGTIPTLDELHQMPYTLRVIKETLRLYPPAAYYPRDVVETDVLGGYAIQPGKMVMLFPYATHRHPDFWDEPERFDPERFQPEREKERHPQAYAPFSAGQRVCIGNKFSLLEAQIMLGMIYKQFRPRLVAGHDPKIDAPSILMPTAGMPMYLDPR